MKISCIRNFVFALTCGFLFAGCETLSEGSIENATFTPINYSSLDGKKKQLMRIGIAPIDAGSRREINEYAGMYQYAKDRLALTEYMVDRVGNSVLITIPKHAIMQGDLQIDDKDGYLNTLVDVLKKYPKTYVELTGHTSHISTPSTNFRVSQIRSGTLAKWLNSAEIHSERMFITGLGAARRIDDDSTVKGKALNNRIEVRIIPIY